MLAAVAITDALRQDCALEARVKWPNDVLVPPAPGDPADAGDLRKVAGVLSEVVITPAGAAVVAGIGINVSQEDDELPVPSATSLRGAGSARTDRDPVLRSVLRHLAKRYAEWETVAGDPRAGFAVAYRERCDTIGRAVRVQLPPEGAASLDGVAQGVDDEGRLLLRPNGQPNGTITALSVGDVVHIRPREPA
jgi:BirA family biotin operon repressor/biotin-[acetyl-CoA-carboxylase] ligase